MKRKVLHSGWVRADTIEVGDMVRLDCSDFTRSNWCEVLSVRALAADHPSQRWGDVEVGVSTEGAPRPTPFGPDASPYLGPGSWVAQILLASVLVEVLS